MGSIRQARVSPSGVRALADAYRLGFEQGRAELGAGASETAAREARYAWLEATRVRVGAGILLTAHHADDQAETVLMRSLEGSGPAGLAGMASKRGSLVRPLLPFRREALLRYVRARGLPVWDDPANRDPRHLRAWLRGDVLPMLRARLPRVDESLLAVARHAARERAAWNAVLELLPGADFRLERGGFSVAARGLSGYDSALGVTLLMTAARRVGCRLGPTRATRALRGRRLGARAAPSSSSAVGGPPSWPSAASSSDGPRVRPRRRRGPCAGAEGRVEWGGWSLRWRPETAPPRQERAALTAWFAPGPLVVRPWVAGERIRPLQGRGGRLLVRLFQDARVPRSRRAAWPVLAGPDGLVWVPGVCRSDALLPAAGTEAMRIDAEHA